MKAVTRRKLEMGERVLKFSKDHPDPSPGFATMVAQLEERLARSKVLAERQRIGLSEVRSATRDKDKIRKLTRGSHLAHLSTVAQGITGSPELAAKFEIEPHHMPYTVFRTVAGGMMADAESNKDLLVEHGLAESSLEDLKKNLQAFDEAVDRFNAGRSAHVGASAELDVTGRDIVHIVSVMHALNRGRFANDAELLAGWESASTTFGPRSGGEKPAAPEKTPPPGGESRTVA